MQADDPSQQKLAATQAAIFDALPAYVALVDGAGLIVQVNSAWSQFDGEHALLSRDLTVGSSYLARCEETKGFDAEDAYRTAAAIRRVLRGELERFGLEIACRGLAEPLWLRLVVSPVREVGGGVRAAVVMFVDVTTRKLAEDAIKESEERLRVVFQQAAVGFVLAAGDGRFLKVNDRLADITGYSRPDLMNMRLGDLTLAEDRPAFDAAFSHLFTEGNCGCAIEKRNLRPNGSVYWVRLVVTLVRGGDGRPRYLVGVLDDISERKATEIRLQRLNRLYEVLSRVNEAIVRTADPQSLYEAVCRIATAQGGLRLGVIVEIQEPSGVPGVVAHAGSAGDYLERLELDLSGPLAEGTIGRALLSGSHDICNDFAADPRMLPWRDAALRNGFHSTASFPLRRAGRTIGALVLFAAEPDYFLADEINLMVAVANDISFALDAMERERQRLLVEAELRASEDRYRTLVETSPDLVWAVDLEGRFTFLNQAAQRIYGLPPAELIGRRWLEFAPTGQLEKDMEAFRANTVGASGLVDYETQVVRNDGVTVTLSASAQVVRNAAGKVIGARGISRDVSEREASLAALRQSQSLLNMAGRLARIGAWSYELATATLTWSEQVREIHEVAPDYEPRVETTIELYAAEYRPMLREALGACISEGTPYDLELEIVTTSGRRVWVRSMGEAERDETGAVRRVQGALQDISERRQAAEAIRNLAVRLDSTLESLTDPFYTFDRSWRFTYVNSQAIQMLRRSRAELIGHDVWEAFPELDDSPFGPVYRQAAESGVAAHFEGRYEPFGSWFEVRVYPSHLGLAITARDVTEQRMSRERQREQAALLDEARDAIVVTDLAHQITFWNRSAERIYGWSSAEVLGRSVRDLLPRDPTVYLQAVAGAMEKGEWFGEVEHQDRSGRRLNVEVRLTLVRDESGQPRSVLSIQTDVTERRRMEQQFLRAQRLESIGTLAGGIAHDLNNLLAPIIMGVDLLRQSTGPPKPYVLDSIALSARRGADLVRQVLSFARGVEGSRVSVHLGHLVREIVEIAAKTFPKTIKVETSVPLDLGLVQGDPTQLHQVLLNLCVNARDAMPDGGLLRIALHNVEVDEQRAAFHRGSAPGRYVLAEVQDSGTGMRPEVIERIFEPFFTTKEPGQGTGLGLSTVLGIVRAHGGFVDVHSEPGAGTSFEIYLPALAATETQGDAAADEPAIARAQGELILVADDEQHVREVTQQTLEAHGYQVITAPDGAQAIAAFVARRDEVAAVITDMMMPVMGGAALVVALRHIDPTIRVIAVSGLEPPGGFAKTKATTGVQAILAKPYDARTLLDTLQQVLNEPKGRQ